MEDCGRGSLRVRRKFAPSIPRSSDDSNSTPYKEEYLLSEDDPIYVELWRYPYMLSDQPLGV